MLYITVHHLNHRYTVVLHGSDQLEFLHVSNNFTFILYRKASCRHYDVYITQSNQLMLYTYAYMCTSSLMTPRHMIIFKPLWKGLQITDSIRRRHYRVLACTCINNFCDSSYFGKPYNLHFGILVKFAKLNYPVFINLV